MASVSLALCTMVGILIALSLVGCIMHVVISSGDED